LEKKCLNHVKNHEKNQIHLISVKLWFSEQSENLETIDKQLKIEIQKEESYWQQVLHRLIETIIFLSFREPCI
jgi:CTP:phosphocholine cytidylyltransferase-like protein